MISSKPDPLRRGLKACAVFALNDALRVFLNSLRPGHKGKHVKHISDHLARDIGISPAGMERQRHVWPSESVDRPPV